MSKKTILNEKGYPVFKDNPNILLHRWLYEKKKLGEKIPDGFQIHHLDGIKTNNKLDNLIMLTEQDHYDFHEYLKSLKKYEKEEGMVIFKPFGIYFLIGISIYLLLSSFLSISSKVVYLTSGFSILIGLALFVEIYSKKEKD